MSYFLYLDLGYGIQSHADPYTNQGLAAEDDFMYDPTRCGWNKFLAKGVEFGIFVMPCSRLHTECAQQWRAAIVAEHRADEKNNDRDSQWELIDAVMKECHCEVDLGRMRNLPN